MIYLYHGIILSNTKEKPQGNYAKLCEGKKGNHKRNYSAQFHLYSIHEITEFRDTEQIHGCLGLRVGWECL